MVVRFTPTAAAQVREGFWHETQEARELADGRLELRLLLDSRDEIQRWIMGGADHAEVIGRLEVFSCMVGFVKNLGFLKNGR